MVQETELKTLPHLFLKTMPYRILRFLTLHAGESFYEKEIARQTGVSRGAANQILNDLLANGLVTREKQGKMWFYSLRSHPMHQHFRVFENLARLQELANGLAPLAIRVILYGSAAEGTDTAESDIDLFVIAEEPKKVAAEIRKFPSDREIKPVVMTPEEFAVARAKDKAFIEEAKRGLTLFERETDEQRL